MEKLKKIIELTNDDLSIVNGGREPGRCGPPGLPGQTTWSTNDCTNVSCGEGYDTCDDTD